MSTGTHPVLPDATTKTIGPVARIAALLSAGVLESASFCQGQEGIIADPDGRHECTLVFRGPGIPDLSMDADRGGQITAQARGETVTSAAAAALNEMEQRVAKAVAEYSQYCTWVDRHRTRFISRVNAAREHLPGLVIGDPTAP